MGDVSCAECGFPVASDATFCPQCGAARSAAITSPAAAQHVWAPPTLGTAVGEVEPPTEPTTTSFAQPATDSADGVDRWHLRPWMGVLLVALLLVGAITAWRLLSSDEASPASQVATTQPSLPTAPDTTVLDTTVPDTTVPDTTVPDTTVPETTVPDTTEPDTTEPDTTVPDTTVPDTTVLPTTPRPSDPAATPAVPDPETYTGPGSPQVMNAPMPSGPSYEDVRSSLIIAQRLADALATEDWINARSLLARPPADDNLFGLAYGLTDRYSLLLVDARIDGPGYQLLLGTVRNELNQTQTSVGCVEWYVEANRPIVDMLSERLIATYSGAAFSPEGLRNNPELDAQLRSSCAWLPR